MRFAVVGDPVSHSRSPAIHRAAFEATGIDAVYDAIEVPLGGFGTVVAEIERGDLTGVNVTMPLKREAFAACDSVSQEASASGAVNTVTVGEGRIHGDNTDVDGVRHSLERLRVDKAPVLILGGGGAARAACVAVTERDLWVTTRRPGGAEETLDGTGVRGRTVAWGAPVTGAIVVNATPLGMHGEELPKQVLTEASGLVDMVYGDDVSPAVREARRMGIPVSDGIDMLVGQAACAFEIFVGQPAPIEVMERAARA